MNNTTPNSSLLERLTAYSESDYYPFHMPGHKRNRLEFPNPWSIDLTEIEGFDNLHHAEGILNGLQEKAAALFGAKKSFCLVNGSTCGLLAAISAAVKPGGRLLMARSCHKAAYHAVYLRNLTPVYVIPERTDFGIMGSLSPEEVALALEQQPDIQGVLVVSPTYDGVTSDLRAIARIAHAHHIPLIVDEAHGAHLSLAGKECHEECLLPAGKKLHEARLPVSALSCGADLVIQSLHKTLPAFTQTALLHLNSDLIDENALRRFLGIYQSSSPSYLLLASMDKCFQILEEKGARLFDALGQNLLAFYEKCRSLSHVKVFDGGSEKNCFAWDCSKILISATDFGLSGQALYGILQNRYHLQLEMASGHYALALASIMDRKEGFERLYTALEELDAAFPGISEKNSGAEGNFSGIHKALPRAGGIFQDADIYRLPPQCMTIAQALEQPGLSVPLEQSAGAVSREYLYLYPPGIPLLAPGEQIDKPLLATVARIKEAGLPLEGLEDFTNTRINIVNF